MMFCRKIFSLAFLSEAGLKRLFFITLFFTLGLAQSASAETNWSSRPNWAAPAANKNSSIQKSIKQINQSKAEEKEITPFSPGSNNIALDVGQVFLMGDLAEKYSDNIASRLHYTYGVSEIFGFDASVGYSSHSDGDFSMASLVTGLRTNLSWYDKVVPYAVFGMGFYKPSFQVSPTSSVSPLLFGLHLGPGVDLQMTKNLFFGAGVTFHDIFGNTEVTQDGKTVEVGGTFISFLLHVGYTF